MTLWSVSYGRYEVLATNLMERQSKNPVGVESAHLSSSLVASSLSIRRVSSSSRNLRFINGDLRHRKAAEQSTNSWKVKFIVYSL